MNRNGNMLSGGAGSVRSRLPMPRSALTCVEMAGACRRFCTCPELIQALTVVWPMLVQCRPASQFYLVSAVSCLPAAINNTLVSMEIYTTRHRPCLHWLPPPSQALPSLSLFSFTTFKRGGTAERKGLKCGSSGGGDI